MFVYPILVQYLDSFIDATEKASDLVSHYNLPLQQMVMVKGVDFAGFRSTKLCRKRPLLNMEAGRRLYQGPLI